MKTLLSLILFFAASAHALPKPERSAFARANPGHDLVHPVIARGTQVSPAGETWKYVVKINSMAGSCTGVFISPSALLTAGHCEPRGDLWFYIYRGSEPLTVKFFKPGDYLFKRHHDYSNDLEESDGDLAILVFRETILPSTHRVASVVDEGDLPVLSVGSKTIHVGAGKQGNGGTDGILHFAYGRIAGYKNASTLVSEMSDGAEICHGDSGGPTFVRSSGRLKLAAVHSTVELAGEDCGRRVYTTFLSAGNNDWIASVLGQRFFD